MNHEDDDTDHLNADDTHGPTFADFLSEVDSEVEVITDEQDRASLARILREAGYQCDKLTGSLLRDEHVDQVVDITDSVMGSSTAEPVIALHHDAKLSQIDFERPDDGLIMQFFTENEDLMRLQRIHQDIEEAERTLATQLTVLDEVKAESETARRVAESHYKHVAELRRDADCARSQAHEQAEAFRDAAVARAAKITLAAQEEAAGIIAAAKREADQILHAGKCWVDAIVAAAAENLPESTLVESYFTNPNPDLAAALARLELAARLRDSAAVARILDRLRIDDVTGNSRWLMKHVAAANIRADRADRTARSGGFPAQGLGHADEQVLLSDEPSHLGACSTRNSKYLLWLAGVGAGAGVGSVGHVLVDTSTSLTDALGLPSANAGTAEATTGTTITIPDAPPDLDFIPVEMRSRVRVMLNVVAKDNESALTILIIDDDDRLTQNFLNDRPATSRTGQIPQEHDERSDRSVPTRPCGHLNDSEPAPQHHPTWDFTTGQTVRPWPDARRHLPRMAGGSVALGAVLIAAAVGITSIAGVLLAATFSLGLILFMNRRIYRGAFVMVDWFSRSDRSVHQYGDMYADRRYRSKDQFVSIGARLIE